MFRVQLQFQKLTTKNQTGDEDNRCTDIESNFDLESSSQAILMEKGVSGAQDDVIANIPKLRTVSYW